MAEEDAAEVLGAGQAVKETEVDINDAEEEKGMTPWEQHAAVISIPRFDYNAPSSLLQHSHSGFLITCTIKREKSATKEAMSILEKYLRPFSSGSSESLGNLGDNAITKRRKISAEDLGGESINHSENEDAFNNHGNTNRVDTNPNGGPILSLVKLTRSGLLLFTFPIDTPADTVGIVSNIMESLESGISRSALWCHRIFPVQATCRLNEKELQAVVSKLVLQFMNDKQHEIAHPVKFAVGYNRRGIEEAQMKNLKEPNGSHAFALLDRDKCFAVVAAAVKSAVPDSVVDLKTPELSVLVEFLPLFGVPNGSLVVAVSVLPQNLVNTKPRLSVRALVSDTKVKDGKHSNTKVKEGKHSKDHVAQTS